jgi:hypothetical protein
MAPSGKLRLVVVRRYLPDPAIRLISGTLPRAWVVDYDSKSKGIESGGTKSMRPIRRASFCSAT